MKNSQKYFLLMVVLLFFIADSFCASGTHRVSLQKCVSYYFIICNYAQSTAMNGILDELPVSIPLTDQGFEVVNGSISAEVFAQLARSERCLQALRADLESRLSARPFQDRVPGLTADHTG